MLDAVCDAAQEGALDEDNGRLGLRSGEWLESLNGSAWGRYRLARSPTSFQYPDPPPGSYLGRSADADWPRAWLLPLGVTDESLSLKGAAHAIAGLVAAAADGPVAATIRRSGA